MDIMYLTAHRKGARAQAQAVLEYILGYDGIDNAYEDEKYRTDFALFRFDNCREQGYMLLDRKSCLCMVWYEHRNSDCICVGSFRTPDSTVEAQDWFDYLDEHRPNATKWDMYDESFQYGHAGQAADYIVNQFEKEY